MIYQISKFTYFGNSLIAITNAIKLAISDNAKLQMPPGGSQEVTYEFLKRLPDLDFSEGKAEGTPIVSKFYFRESCNGMSPTMKERREYLLKYIRPHLQLKELDLDDDTLVIHVRSGDIFGYEMAGKPAWIHQQYLQPPLEYYQMIIEKEAPKKIIIVSTPDFGNPVIAEIQKMHENVELITGTLQNDVSVLVSAKKLVTGFGSFAIMCALMSEKLEVLYKQEPFHDLVYLTSEKIPNDFSDVNFSVVSATFPNYRDGIWENTPHQRQRMIEYTGTVLKEGSSHHKWSQAGHQLE